MKIGRIQRALYANLAQAGETSVDVLYRGERKALAGLERAGLVHAEGDSVRVVPPWDLPVEIKSALHDPPDPDLLEDLRQRSPGRLKRPDAKSAGGPPILSLSVTEGAHAALMALGPGEVRALLGRVAELGLNAATATIKALPQPYADTIAEGARKVYGIAIPPEWTSALKGKTLTGRTRDLVIGALGAGWPQAVRALQG